MTDPAYLGALIPQALIEIHDEENVGRKMALSCAKQVLDSIGDACGKAGIRCEMVARQLQMMILGGVLLQQVVGNASATRIVRASIDDLIQRARAAPRGVDGSPYVP